MGKRIPGMGLTATAMTALLVGGGVAAAASPAEHLAQPHASVQLIAEQSCLRPGSAATIGIHFTIESGWHIYWNGRNDSGFAPEIEWTLPEGLTIDAVQWPAPVRHVAPGDILDHVYEDHVTLLVPVQVSSAFKPDGDGARLTIKAKVKYLVCNEACVPEDASVSLTLPVCSPGLPPHKSADAPKFVEARKRIPATVGAEFKDLGTVWTKETVTLKVIGAAGLTFFPASDCADLDSPITTAQSTTTTLTLRPGGDPAAIRGVLEVRRPRGAPSDFYSINLEPPKVRDPGPSPIGAPQPPKPR